MAPPALGMRCERGATERATEVHPSGVAIEDDWLTGWDPLPGIVSVWAEPDGRATLWRRVDGALVRDDLRFRPWVVVAHLADVEPELGTGRIATRELAGDGALRHLLRADDLETLTGAILRGASRRLGRH